MTRPAQPARIGYVIGTYPSLTTTFIDREIRGLRAMGADIEILSIRHPGPDLSDATKTMMVGISYLLPASPIKLVAAHLTYGVRLEYWKILTFLLTAPHPGWKARLKTLAHFGEAILATHILDNMSLRRIHAHFVDRAAVVAMTASRLLGIPYSVTAHANDIYVNPILLEAKLESSEFAVTCTEFNRVHLASFVSPETDLIRLYHGLELDRYQPQPSARQSPPMILAVGQLKEKKGLGDLIAACAGLAGDGRQFSCVIIGDGPLRHRLESQILEAGLSDRLTLTGALAHHQVVESYRRASIFALPCVTASDGDRDGIPNVVLEAMAMALPVVSTRHSGVPEAVEDGVSGILVPPGDVTELTDALARLLDDPDLRSKMGLVGREIATDRFDVTVNAKALMERFRR